MSNHARTLRVAYLVGAATDALAIVPLVFPSVAAFVWGMEDTSPSFRFAAASSAALMLGWTVLLLWASRRPVERRAVAAFTILVIVGLVLAEVFAVMASVVSPVRMAPTWALQLLLVALFSAGLLRSPRHRGGVA